MKKELYTMRASLVVAALWMALSSTLLIAEDAVVEDPIVVIVNVKNPISEMKLEEVQDHYLNRQMFESGDKVWRFYDNTDDALRLALVKLMNMATEGDITAYFKKMGYQSHLSGEKGLAGGALTATYVGKVNGGFGVVRMSAIAGNATVKVVYTLK